MTEMPPGTFTDQAFDPDDPTAPERLERIGTNGAKKNRRGADGEKTTRADNVGSTAAGLDDEAHVKLDEWDASADVEPPPPRGWLLGNTFCRKFMSSLYGDGAVGKTAVRYAQYLALATGRPLTGEHVFQRCRVLIISLEDGADELRRRILAARIHHRIELEELRDWLFLSAPGPEVGKLMTVDQKGRGVRGQLAEVIERASGGALRCVPMRGDWTAQQVSDLLHNFVQNVVHRADQDELVLEFCFDEEARVRIPSSACGPK